MYIRLNSGFQDSDRRIELLTPIHCEIDFPRLCKDEMRAIVLNYMLLGYTEDGEPRVIGHQ